MPHSCKTLLAITLLAGSLLMAATPPALATGASDGYGSDASSGDSGNSGTVYLQVPIGDMATTTQEVNGVTKTVGVIEYDTSEPNSLLMQYTVLVYDYLKKIIATLAATMVVVGGVLWAVSGGDQSKVAKGKEIITRTLVALGVFIVLGLILEMLAPGITDGF
jgi:hypothetical protein